MTAYNFWKTYLENLTDGCFLLLYCNNAGFIKYFGSDIQFYNPQHRQRLKTLFVSE